MKHPIDDSPELLAKLRSIRMLVLDVDGVLSDGSVFLGGPLGPGREHHDPDAWQDAGRWFEIKCFDIKDGLAIRLAGEGGLLTAILTGRRSIAVAERARELGFDEVIQGQGDKLPAFEALCARRGIEGEAVAYMGDDLPDLPVLRRVGLATAPRDAVDEVLRSADLVVDRRGGHGAVRLLVETILKAQGKWEAVTARYMTGKEGTP